MSAAPMGSPGWPDFACSTASIASARMAFAMRSWAVREMDAAPCSANAAEASETAARLDFVMIPTQGDSWIEPLARGWVESKEARRAIRAMHRPGENADRGVDGRSRMHVRVFL